MNQTFELECPNCEEELSVEFDEQDMADPPVIVCDSCGSEFDCEIQEGKPVIVAELEDDVTDGESDEDVEDLDTDEDEDDDE